MSGLLDVINQSQAPAAENTCDVCGHNSRRLFQANGYWILECGRCGHQFVERGQHAEPVVAIYGDEYFNDGKGGYRGYLHEQSVLLSRARWYAQLLSQRMAPGTVLDIGTAAGFFLSVLADRGWKAQGIEPNASMAAFARNQFQLTVHHRAFEDYGGPGEFDLLTMLQVIAHFARPREAVLKAARLIKPGGYLLIESWDRHSFTASAFGRSWHEYNPPSVLHMFSRTGLIRMVSSAGFELTAYGRPRRWITAGHAQSVLQHRSASSLTYRLLFAISKLLPQQTAIPYPGNDLFWALFRRTLNRS
jgi:SAM-dependent methyltransferase